MKLILITFFHSFSKVQAGILISEKKKKKLWKEEKEAKTFFQIEMKHV